MQLIVANDDYVKIVDVDASSDERYPHLERALAKPDELAKIYAPKTSVAPPEKTQPARYKTTVRLPFSMTRSSR